MEQILQHHSTAIHTADNPNRFQLFSGSTLKLIAVISMLIDHIAATLLNNTARMNVMLCGRFIPLYMIMRTIGRLAFPIFAFLIVEGFVYSHDRIRYGANLFGFALLSEIPWNLNHFGTVLSFENRNVYFTLLLGFLGLCALQLLREHLFVGTAAFLSLFAISCTLNADYRWFGFLLIVLLFITRKNRVVQCIVGAALCILTHREYAALAFLPLLLYNEKRGFIQNKHTKYAFYAFYPVHLFVLYLIKLNFIGY